MAVEPIGDEDGGGRRFWDAPGTVRDISFCWPVRSKSFTLGGAIFEAFRGEAPPPHDAHFSD